MSDESLQLTKFDVAERQLNQAIRLFFDGGDVISIHTLAEAAAQVLYDTRAQHGGGFSLIRDNDRIRDERRKKWLSYAHQSKNFFKHADRDGASTHKFTNTWNHFSLLDAVNLYLTAKQSWTPETLMFVAWFSLEHPNLLKEGDEMYSLVAKHLNDSDPINPKNLSVFGKCITELRECRLSIPGITLAMGLVR